MEPTLKPLSTQSEDVESTEHSAKSFERVQERHNGREGGHKEHLEDRVTREPSALAHLPAPDDVEAREERAVQATEETKKDEHRKLPIVVLLSVRHGEQDDRAIPVRVEGAKRDRRDGCTPEGAPHDLGWEVVRHFLEREEDTADRCAEGHGHAGRTRRRENLTALQLVVVVLRERAGDNVGYG
jgi:hypothetical protein